jgi:peptidoglycan/xylan/chitin deacetylase (PgdA/CDA1 family)
MLKEMKRTVLRVMQNTGLFKILSQSGWRTDRLLILGYHGISQDDEHIWNPELYMSPEQFQSHLEMIRDQGFTVLDLDEAVERMYAGTLPAKSLSITFDDGSVDFYRKAYPLIREAGYPVSLYLTTYYCHNNKPVFTTSLAYILWKARGRTAPSPPMLGTDSMLDLGSDASRREAWETINGFADTHGLSGNERHQLLEQVAACTGYDFQSMLSRRLLHLMNPEEVAEVARNGVDIQLHSHRHRRPHERRAYQREIAENREIIEAITGERPVHFCYPVGRTHPDFLPWLEEEGVASATTCNSGLADRNSNPLLLPRLICDSKVTPLEFSAWLSGAAALLPRRRHVPAG